LTKKYIIPEKLLRHFVESYLFDAYRFASDYNYEDAKRVSQEEAEDFLNDLKDEPSVEIVEVIKRNEEK